MYTKNTQITKELTDPGNTESCELNMTDMGIKNVKVFSLISIIDRANCIISSLDKKECNFSES